ncbi:MAG: UDP-N-acetylglucosamine 1-carboxyvinyltransferase [Gemmatimonadetes bacterium]|nr:UDP-N-acetylglucosamine 1-carboxyvinyltransferase [Gemmatimonadota bacterium]NNM04292.1 UDP-N-acetylglucosamine 1-carboxyvinyltransferase [Gemmatimonadota bacterium]
MPRFVVEGARRLEGAIRPAGNKNAALPAIAATLLTSEEVVLQNVPRIRDVETLLELLKSLGASVEWRGENEVGITAGDLPDRPPDPELAERIRASILLAGPLLARVNNVELGPPGGDVIGRRRLDTHFLALEGLGAVRKPGPGFSMETQGLVGADLFLDEPSVTGTENAVMAAALARGRTVIRNAAAEPHVQDLCNLLNQMGAGIQGIGTHILEIDGVQELHGTTFRLSPDHIETGSFIGLAAATGSKITIEDAPLAHLDSTLLGFRRLGVECTPDGTSLVVHGDRDRVIRQDAFGHVPKIDDGPWPAFPADLTSIALVAATQCRGTILIHEKMFESRMYFTDKLVGMGAQIILCDPHRAVVVGPAQLRGSVLESPDIRAGMALLIAALGADGTSQIKNIGQIERGYQHIDARLKALGAQITRVNGDR